MIFLTLSIGWKPLRTIHKAIKSVVMKDQSERMPIKINESLAGQLTIMTIWTFEAGMLNDPHGEF